MNSNDKSTALDTRSDYFSGVDLNQRLPKILQSIQNHTGFQIEKEIWRSRYYGSEQIGAVHYRGTWQNLPTVLKIQGAEPLISEFDMISSFARQNRSQVVRPPVIYWHQAWRETDHYEAFIMEEVGGEKVLQSGQLQPAEIIRNFLQVYTEYRSNCLPEQPWIPTPAPPDFQETLIKAWHLTNQRYPNDLRRQDCDMQLTQSATTLLAEIYAQVPLGFMHGHFSVEDLIRQEDQVVLFSNLYWKWKYPYYDAIFGYHWYMFTLQHVEGITPDQIEKQRQIWMEELFALPTVVDITQQRLLQAALLERAIAGLVLDSFLVVPTHPLADYFTQTQRDEIDRLSEVLSE